MKLAATGCAAALWACLLSSAMAESPLQFRDVTAHAGITFKHTDGSGGNYYIVEYVASGLATFDYDGDGLIDIYFLNGAPLRGTRTDSPTPGNRLYRNLGGWKFRDVTVQAGVGGTGFALGVAVGDYDNDGRPDLYVNNFGPNVLYRNDGDGTFSDMTAEAGVGRENRVGAGTNFLDIDGDGWLDLFVSNYIRFRYEGHVLRTMKGVPTYPSPLDYPPETNNLFRNNGDGTFADVSESSGIASQPGTGMGTICADYDLDGATDIFVANDVMGSFLFKNDGKGHFEDVGVLSGIAYDAGGIPHGNMGVDCGDYDRDGQPDFFVTSYHREMPALYRNLGGGLFDDVTRSARAGQSSYPHVKWGCGLVDFDNDGYKDIFIGCGHLADKAELIDDTTAYQVRPILLRNTGDGKFADISAACGEGMQVKMVARGVAFDDLDNDGDIDVVVLNSRRGPTLLQNMVNDSGSTNHWLQLELRGTRTNRGGVGALVKVVAGELTLIDEVHSGRSYQSHFGSRLHFGLGDRDRVDRVEVRWIGGGAEIFDRVAANRCLTLTEGTGVGAE